MIIFSKFHCDKKFIKINNIKDCDGLDSHSYAFFTITSQNHLEYFLSLAKELYDSEIEYAVVFDKKVFFSYMRCGNRYSLSPTTDYDCFGIPYGYIPLNAAMLMFSKLCAKFLILDSGMGKDGVKLLAFAQSLANYYLLDSKILAAVDSYRDIQELSFIDFGSFCNKEHSDFIGIDGVIEKSLLEMI